MVLVTGEKRKEREKRGCGSQVVTNVLDKLQIELGIDKVARCSRRGSRCVGNVKINMAGGYQRCSWRIGKGGPNRKTKCVDVVHKGSSR